MGHLKANGTRLADRIYVDRQLEERSSMHEEAPLAITWCLGSETVRDEIPFRKAGFSPTHGFAGSFLVVDIEDTIPTLSSFMLAQLNSGSESFDVMFEVGGERIGAHRLPLLRIPYFNTLLSGTFAEGRT